MMYEVDATINGITSPIDTVIANDGYTAADYIRDCNVNADAEWCEMISACEITLTKIEF